MEFEFKPLYLCVFPDCDCPREGTTDFCATHNHEMRKAAREALKPKKTYQLARSTKPIAPISPQMRKALYGYSEMKAEWIQGKRCAVFQELQAEDIHHMMGRIGYADKWARDNDIPLLIDQRFWLPVSRKGHFKIGEEPAWARDMKFCLPRIESLIKNEFDIGKLLNNLKKNEN